MGNGTSDDINESEIVGYVAITDAPATRQEKAEMEQMIAEEVGLAMTPEDRTTVRSMFHVRDQRKVVIVTPWMAIADGSERDLQRRGEQTLGEMDGVIRTSSFYTTGNPIEVLHDRTAE